MKHYILIDKVIAKKALTNLDQKQEKEKNLSLNILKKMCLVNSFRPDLAQTIGWYEGVDTDNVNKILDIIPSEVSWYQGKGIVFTEVDPKTTKEGNYHCLPFNNPEKAKGIIEILENKKYSNIYLVIDCKSDQLNTSFNRSINLTQKYINNFDNSLAALFQSEEDKKKELENIIKEQNEKINVLQKSSNEQEVKFNKDLEDLKNQLNLLLIDKEQAVAQMQREIDIRQTAVDQRGEEINRLNVCLQNEVNRQKELVKENEEKINSCNNQLKNEQLNVSNLQNQLDKAISDRNNWQNKFTNEQIEVGKLSNEKSSLEQKISQRDVYLNLLRTGFANPIYAPNRDGKGGGYYNIYVYKWTGIIRYGGFGLEGPEFWENSTYYNDNWLTIGLRQLNQ